MSSLLKNTSAFRYFVYGAAAAETLAMVYKLLQRQKARGKQQPGGEAKLDKVDEQAKVLAFHTVSDPLPVAQLDCKDAFEGLNEQERLYSHWLARASWEGSLICLDQTSPESKPIFLMFMLLFKSEPLSVLRAAALKDGVTEQEFTHFLQYACNFFANMGNYLSFGDSKFIPRLSPKKLHTIVLASGAESATKMRIVALWEKVQKPMYSLDPTVLHLGAPPHGVSTYYSPDITEEEVKLVNKVMQDNDISPYNTRVFKLSDQGEGERRHRVFQVRIAAAEHKAGEEYLIGGDRIKVYYGDYNPAILTRVCYCLEQALLYAANNDQRLMLQEYVRHFRQGPIKFHKEAQKHWIKDKGPSVETNIGFIESYRDPYGVRGEFEGFVAVVNKETSKKFAELVNEAPKFLQRLPWSKEYEKDEFKRPDFTSLEVIAFASTGVPAGINIPNYDDIRQDLGFKNVSLGNVIASTPSDAPVPFITEADQTAFKALRVPAFHVQVGAHELLGHGSGKIFEEKVVAGKSVFNFDPMTVNPITGKPVTSWYKEGQTYDTVFGALSSTLEECRAECVGLLLSVDRDMLRIFGHPDEKSQDEITYVNWLSMCQAGIRALIVYNPDRNKWGQAHMQARYAILRTLLAAGKGLVTLKGEGMQTTIHLDASKIRTVGVPAMNAFLRDIQVYKSTADFEGASRMYSDITSVDDRFLALREAIVANKEPRKVFVQAVTREVNGQATLQQYPATLDGLVQSFVDRFGEQLDLVDA